MQDNKFEPAGAPGGPEALVSPARGRSTYSLSTWMGAAYPRTYPWVMIIGCSTVVLGSIGVALWLVR